MCGCGILSSNILLFILRSLRIYTIIYIVLYNYDDGNVDMVHENVAA